MMGVKQSLAFLLLMLFSYCILKEVKKNYQLSVSTFKIDVCLTQKKLIIKEIYTSILG